MMEERLEGQMLEGQPIEGEVPGPTPNPSEELDIHMSDEEVQQLLQQSETLEKQLKGELPPEQAKQEQGEQLLAGKFKTPEELQKGLLNLVQKLAGTDDLEAVYKALEQELGRMSQEQSEEATGEQPTEGEVHNWEEIIDTYIDQYLETGKVPEEALKQFENVDPQLVELAFKARASEVNNYIQSVQNYAGGVEEYQKLMTFVQQNLSPEETAAYAAALQTMDLGLAKLIIDGVKARMNSNPNLLEGTGPSGEPLNAGYGSLDEAIRDINDPRYGVDPKFTREVQRKLINSGFDMGDLF
jgi:leucyl aminopeptidase